VERRVSENRGFDQQSLACQDAGQPHAQNVVSATYAKNNVRDAPNFIEPL
jgi:hypothetical protein